MQMKLLFSSDYQYCNKTMINNNIHSLQTLNRDYPSWIIAKIADHFPVWTVFADQKEHSRNRDRKELISHNSNAPLIKDWLLLLW